VFKNDYIKSDLQCFDKNILKSGFQSFLNENLNYKETFLQKNFKYGFDGYSFLGQKDSSNQYETDLLHSFVISDFCDQSLFPKEFQNFMDLEWKKLQIQIRKLELEIIQQLNINGLENFYNENIGHMISCNYYPKTELFNFSAKNNTRLSEHTDVSLFTIFPFGFDKDFYYQNFKGEWIQIEATNNIVVFPGYLLEVFTKGKIKALKHCVKLPENRNTERFSFAYFSLPYPNRKFKMAYKNYTSESYFEEYLNLF
jgi:hypothetical protein